MANELDRVHSSQARRGRWARAFCAAGLWVLVGCGRDTTQVQSPPKASGSTPAAARSTAPAAPSAAGSGSAAAPSAGAAPAAAPSAVAAVRPSGGFRFSAPGRIIAIGDLHGDLAATRAALRLGGAIDAADRWIGEDLTVVQTGDQLDRGDQEREILDLLAALVPQARARGGQLIILNGNHEIMNAQGDFRYVTPAGFTAFAGVAPRSPLASGASPAYAARAAAFLPGGAYALHFAERDVIAVVGDSVFVHGGVTPEHVRYGIDRINSEARQWFKGSVRAAPESVAGQYGPVWVRDYSLDPVSPSACEALAQVLAALEVKRMVVGHTVQAGGITSGCGDTVYRIDVGLSRYYGQGAIQVLEIAKGEVRTLSTPRVP